MAPLPDYSFSRKKVLLFLYLLSFLFSSSSSVVNTIQIHTQHLSSDILGRRGLLQVEETEETHEPIKKKSAATGISTSTSSSSGSALSTSKNKTKLLKPTTNSTKPIKIKTKTNSTGTDSTKNQAKPLKLTPNSSSTKNKTKLIKPTATSTATKDSFDETPNTKIKLKKLNSTSKASSNSTKPNTSFLNKKSSDLTKNNTTRNQSDQKPKTQKKPTKPSLFDQEDEEDDLVSGFRDLPTKFQETLLPDLEIISKTSKVYLNRANKEITNGFKPIVGKRYAPTIASVVSCAFILIPLALVSLIFNRIKAFFSLQKLLIFIQIYLSIYFSILCLSSLVTGLEPLRFFYATSQSTYICLQLLQTLGYVLYLLLLLMYLVLVFSTESGMGSKLLGLGQTFVGFAVGLHYYMTVFHRAVLHQPPKTSWKVHAVYATCFLLICLLARAERRKKAYVADGGEEGKKS